MTNCVLVYVIFLSPGHNGTKLSNVTKCHKIEFSHLLSSELVAYNYSRCIFLSNFCIYHVYLYWIFKQKMAPLWTQNTLNHILNSKNFPGGNPQTPCSGSLKPKKNSGSEFNAHFDLWFCHKNNNIIQSGSGKYFLQGFFQLSFIRENGTVQWRIQDFDKGGAAGHWKYFYSLASLGIHSSIFIRPFITL